MNLITRVLGKGPQASNSSPTSLDNATATRMGLKSYSHGTTYNGGNAPTISAGNAQSGLVVNTSAFIPYQMQDGSWRLKFNFNISYTSTIYSATLVAGIGVNSSHPQAISIAPGDGNTLATFEQIPTAVYLSTTSTYFGNRFSVAMTKFAFSGDIALTAKPTWAY